MDQQGLRYPAGSEAGLHQILALGHEQAQRLAVLFLPKLADQSSVFRCLGW